MRKKWVLYISDLNKHNIYFINIYESQNSFFFFCSTASHFYVIGNFETCSPNDPKLPWILQGQRYHTYVLFVPLNPAFQYVSPYNEFLRVTHRFVTNALNDAKITLNTARSKVPQICCSNMLPRVRPSYLFHSELRAIVRQVWNDPQMKLNTTRSKVLLCMCQILVSFPQQPAVIST